MGPLDNWMDGCDDRERRAKGLFGCMDAVRARVTHLDSHSLITAWLTLHRPKVSNFSYPPSFLHPFLQKSLSAFNDWKEIRNDHESRNFLR